MIFQNFNSGGIFNFNLCTYENFNFESHFHKNIEFVFVADGEVEITSNSITASASKGQFAIILPYHMHSFRTMHSSRTVVGVFSNDYVSKFVCDIGGKTPESFVFNAGNDIAECFCRLEQMNKFHIMGILYGLCGEFMAQTSFSESASAKNITLNRIMIYISENIRSDITLQSLADNLGYEKHYLSRLFNAGTGTNFRKFINMCRIEIAREMLESSDKTITEIAFDCGFSGIRTFNRSFKQCSGCTPIEYRKTFMAL